MVLDKLNILSRKSDLAIIQAREFGQILSSNLPSIKLNYIVIIKKYLLTPMGYIILECVSYYKYESYVL